MMNFMRKLLNPPIELETVEEEELDYRAPRESAYTPARIVNRSGTSFDCMLMNISETGAMVRFSARSPIMPGDSIVLHVSNRGLKNRCRAIWRDYNELGVQFTNALQ